MAVRVDNLVNRLHRLEFMLRVRAQCVLKGARVDITYPRDLRIGRRIVIQVEHGAHTTLVFGERTTIHDDVTLWLQGGSLRCGDGMEVRRWCTIVVGAEVSIGEDVTISYSTFLSANEGITIGSRTGIAHHVTIADVWHFYTPDAPVPVARNIEGKPIIIGEDCWLASGAMVFGGAVLADHSVVAAASDVSGRTNAWSLTKHGANSEIPLPGRFIRRSTSADASGAAAPTGDS